MDLLYILFLAIAISLDGFFVGVTYGIRRIKVSFLPLCVISLVSSTVITISLLLGSTLQTLISPWLSRVVGASILIVVGMLVLKETYKSMMVQKDVYSGYSIVYSEHSEITPKEILTWKIKPFGIVIQILKEPTRADFDFSGSISCFEAVFLGLALALDAFGAGFGAGMTGFSPLLIPACVGLTKFVFVSSGNYLGGRFSNLLNSRTAYLPGAILIGLGILKLF
jgi:putative sporulation protein YtaF